MTFTVSLSIHQLIITILLAILFWQTLLAQDKTQDYKWAIIIEIFQWTDYNEYDTQVCYVAVIKYNKIIKYSNWISETQNSQWEKLEHSVSSLQSVWYC